MEFSRPNPTTMQVVQTDDTPSWIFEEGYGYWTSTATADKADEVWYVNPGGFVYSRGVGVYYYNYYGAIRPVITISKSALN